MRTILLIIAAIATVLANEAPTPILYGDLFPDMQFRSNQSQD